MRTKINTKNFLIALKKHEKICKSKTNFSVLGGVLISYDEKKMSITSTTMEISAQTFLDCKSTGESKIVFPYEKLLKIVSKIKNEEFILDDNIIIDENLKFALNTFNLEDFPDLPTIASENSFKFNLTTQILKESLNFVSKDQSQYTLSGALLQNTRLATIDGRRLYCYNFYPIENFAEIIIPAQILEVIAKNEKFEFFELRHDDKNLQIIVNGAFYTAVKMQGKFPNIDLFITEKYHSSVDLDTKEILQAMDRLSVMVDKESNKMIFSDGEISVQNSNCETARAEIWQDGNFPYVFGLNYKLFTDILKICPEKISLKFKDETLTPIQIDCDNKNLVIMPMKIN